MSGQYGIWKFEYRAILNNGVINETARMWEDTCKFVRLIHKI